MALREDFFLCISDFAKICERQEPPTFRKLYHGGSVDLPVDLSSSDGGDTCGNMCRTFLQHRAAKFETLGLDSVEIATWLHIQEDRIRTGHGGAVKEVRPASGRRRGDASASVLQYPQAIKTQMILADCHAFHASSVLCRQVSGPPTILERLFKHRRFVRFRRRIREAVYACAASKDLTFAPFCRSGLHRGLGLSYLV